MRSSKTRLAVILVLIAVLCAAVGLLYANVEAPAAADASFDTWDYLENYDENVEGDPAFAENLTAALQTARSEVKVYGTWFSLLPPIIAIVLALLTKEVYSSLFVGILSGALLYSGFSFTGTIDHLFVDGFIGALADSYNVGILLFLVVLGTITVLMNRAGGSAAFGRWAAKHIKSRIGAQLQRLADKTTNRNARRNIFNFIYFFS